MDCSRVSVTLEMKAKFLSVSNCLGLQYPNSASSVAMSPLYANCSKSHSIMTCLLLVYTANAHYI